MRTMAQEAASQIILKNCSKEVGGEVSIICDFSEGGYMQSGTHFGRGLLLVLRSRCLLERLDNDFSAFLHVRRCKTLGS